MTADAKGAEMILRQQMLVCLEHNVECIPPDLSTSKVGFAINTQGKLPVNGLRHPAIGDSNGWYIWCGEEVSQRDDFFAPLHTSHLIERCPEALDFLGLPPGWRFLVAGDYVDVWFDPQLLEV